jgi:hypothetical protein
MTKMDVIYYHAHDVTQYEYTSYTGKLSLGNKFVYEIDAHGNTQKITQYSGKDTTLVEAITESTYDNHPMFFDHFPVDYMTLEQSPSKNNTLYEIKRTDRAKP